MVKSPSIPNIYLTKEYKEMIDSNKVKNKAGLARIKGASKARVTQILNLLKLNKNMTDNLKKIGDPINRKIISEKELRKIIHKN